MQTLETITNEAVYRAMLKTQPAMVEAIADLIHQGQTPAQIEERMIAKCGRNQITRNMRHAADYIASTQDTNP